MPRQLPNQFAFRLRNPASTPGGTHKAVFARPKYALSYGSTASKALGVMNSMKNPGSMISPELRVRAESLEFGGEQNLVSPQADQNVTMRIKRPNIYVTNDSKFTCADISKLWKISREKLMNLVPEGLCGELSHDVVLTPSTSRPVSMMIRRVTYELFQEVDSLISRHEMLQQELKARNLREQVSSFKGESSSFKDDLLGTRQNAASRGFLLEGHRGSGKSCVLNSLVVYARSKNVLVLFEPNARKYLHEVLEIERSETGVFMQKELTRQFLGSVMLYNAELLEQIPVNESIYGMCAAVDGTDRGYYARVTSQLQGGVARGKERMKLANSGQKVTNSGQKSLGSLSPLPRVQNLRQLAQMGIDSPDLAVQVAAELFCQLKSQTHFPVLVAVDGWNELFPVSSFLSIRYDNTKFNGRIPGYHLSMPRLLIPFDHTEYACGMKVFTTTWRHRNRRDFKPELLGVPWENIKQVRAFNGSETATMLAHFGLSGISHNLPEERLNWLFCASQGNPRELRRLVTTLF